MDFPSISGLQLFLGEIVYHAISPIIRLAISYGGAVAIFFGNRPENSIPRSLIRDLVMSNTVDIPTSGYSLITPQ
jgi:hypothetical protein